MQVDFFDLVHDMLNIRSAYQQLENVEVGRKLEMDDVGNFYESSGYNTNIIYRIFQSLSRTYSNSVGYDATALGTKNALEALNCLAFVNLTEIIKCFDEKQLEKNPYLLSVYKTNLVAQKEVIIKAQTSITTLSSTYANEGDNVMGDMTNREAEKCGELVSLIGKTLERYEEEPVFKKKVDTGVQADLQPVHKVKSSNAPPSPVPPKPPSTKPLSVLLKDKINEIPSQRPEVVKDNFITFFQSKCSLDDLENINRLLENKLDEVSVDSEVGKELDNWKTCLSSDLDKGNLKAGFKLALADVTRQKREQPIDLQSSVAPDKGDMHAEFMNVVKEKMDRRREKANLE